MAPRPVAEVLRAEFSAKPRTPLPQDDKAGHGEKLLWLVPPVYPAESLFFAITLDPATAFAQTLWGPLCSATAKVDQGAQPGLLER